jgi:hypothetical protein
LNWIMSVNNLNKLKLRTYNWARNLAPSMLSLLMHR